MSTVFSWVRDGGVGKKGSWSGGEGLDYVKEIEFNFKDNGNYWKVLGKVFRVDFFISSGE